MEQESKDEPDYSIFTKNEVEKFHNSIKKIQRNENLIDFDLESSPMYYFHQLPEEKEIRMKLIAPGNTYPIHLKSGQKFYCYCEVEEINFPLTFKISSKSSVTETFISFFKGKPWKDSSNIISRNKEIRIEYPEDIRRKNELKEEQRRKRLLKEKLKKKKRQKQGLIPKEQMNMFLASGEKSQKLKTEPNEEEQPHVVKFEGIRYVYFTVKAHNAVDANLRIYYYRMKTYGDVKKKGMILIEKNMKAAKGRFKRLNYSKFKKFLRYGLVGLKKGKKKKETKSYSKKKKF